MFENLALPSDAFSTRRKTTNGRHSMAPEPYIENHTKMKMTKMKIVLKIQAAFPSPICDRIFSAQRSVDLFLIHNFKSYIKNIEMLYYL